MLSAPTSRSASFSSATKTKATPTPTFKGIQEATKALGISENNIVWKYSIGEDESCYDACVDCVDQGCQIVITNSYGHQSFCRQAAEEYPDVQFVAMTGDTARADGLA